MTDSASESCYQAYLGLRQEMDAWLRQSRSLDPPSRHHGGEDEANYALAWFDHYLVTGSNELREHFDYLKDLLAGWVERECYHGYEPEAEAHHGTEPFLLFLPRYIGLFPDDDPAKRLLGDAAEHIGNWVEEVPAWFDWSHNRFFGFQIGTKTVLRDGDQACELAEHYRFIHIALAAYRFLGEERYLDWALRYGRRRAGQLRDVQDGPLPVMWGQEDQPIWESELTDGQARLSGSSHRAPNDPLAGVEVLLASGAIHALADLFELSDDQVFQDAARRIAAPLVDGLSDPYGDPGAAAVSTYRRAFRDNSLDKEIRPTIEKFPEEDPGEWMLMLPEVQRRLLPGIGKRQDMLFWGKSEDPQGEVHFSREPSTTALTLAWHMTGELSFAARALDQAWRKLKVSRRILRGGREHADMGGAICSVAAGHGRNWGCGVVTGCYGPLLLGTHLRQGGIEAAVEIQNESGDRGSPDEIMPIVDPAERRICFHNGGDKAVGFQWRLPGDAWESELLEPGVWDYQPMQGARG